MVARTADSHPACPFELRADNALVFIHLARVTRRQGIGRSPPTIHRWSVSIQTPAALNAARNR
jgi:hypothetical protein